MINLGNKEGYKATHFEPNDIEVGVMPIVNKRGFTYAPIAFYEGNAYFLDFDFKVRCCHYSEGSNISHGRSFHFESASQLAFQLGMNIYDFYVRQDGELLGRELETSL